MNVLTTKREVEERDVISVLELFNIKTNERTVVATFDELIEQRFRLSGIWPII